MAADKQDQKKLADDKTENHCEVDTIFIQIGENGEINAWGLDQDSEEVILERTGNQNLALRQQKMSYNLCG